MDTERLSYPDIARGAGILLVVAGHCITAGMASVSGFLGLLRSYIYIIHMPLFFILSGILFERNRIHGTQEPAGIYCRKKAWVFMMPYLAFSILDYAVIYVCMAIPPLAAVLGPYGYHAAPAGETLLAILTYAGHQDTHLWFVYVMFLILVLNRTLLYRQTPLRTAGLFLLYFISVLLPENMPVLPVYTMQYLFLFSFGRSLYASGRLKADLKRAVFGICLHLAAFMLTQAVPSETLGLFHGVLILAVKCTAACLILAASQAAGSGRIVSGLKYLGSGKVSYVIYLIHMPFLTSGLVFLLQRSGMPDALTVLAASAASIFLCLLFYQTVFQNSRIVRTYFFGSTDSQTN